MPKKRKDERFMSVHNVGMGYCFYLDPETNKRTDKIAGYTVTWQNKYSGCFQAHFDHKEPAIDFMNKLKGMQPRLRLFKAWMRRKNAPHA